MVKIGPKSRAGLLVERLEVLRLVPPTDGWNWVPGSLATGL